MRPLVITQNATVDGAIEMLDDWFDPQHQAEDMLAISERDSAATDAMVLGRRTFEDFRGYWPQQTDDTTGITDELNHLDKYVVSASMTDPAWQNSAVIATDPVAAVRDLMDRPGGEITMTGSITLCHTVITAGLVSEYRIWTYPYVQGRGRRLFPDGFRARLRLVEQLCFDSGVTYTRWITMEDQDDRT